MATHSSILAWRIPMDRGAWWATVHGIAKSWTRHTHVHQILLIHQLMDTSVFGRCNYCWSECYCTVCVYVCVCVCVCVQRCISICLRSEIAKILGFWFKLGGVGRSGE